jgi:hydrogenase maturation protein HypF
LPLHFVAVVKTVARRLRVSGIVQGVGFRPFVYQLALRHDLKGQVANTAGGVTIHVQGRPDALGAFERDLVAQPPPLARITGVQGELAEVQATEDFTIVASSGGEERSTLISPDVSVCDDCLAELFDPDDRRHRYPFINCTNCGPRYTIIDDIPYDRPNTSMKTFRMCARCQAEYDDPLDRRFHAQPNACGVCGPRVRLHQADGTPDETGDPIGRTAALLARGRIMAVKGLGGFHLAVDAHDEAAVARLRRRKLREEKPFALMARDLDRIRTFARLDAASEELLTSAARPIVLLPRKPDNAIAAWVAPRNRYFGVMLPYTPLHHLLLEKGSGVLVMTSGNLSEEPICIDNQEAFERLGAIADGFLVHDRDIYLRSDDSIVRRVAGTARFLRRSRGYVPVPVFLKDNLPPVLAVGAELKNTVCLTKADRAFVSQHIGDLENAATNDFFRLTVQHLKRILGIAPRIMAHDLHPDYLSTRYAVEQDTIPTVAVQHHHAHIVSCLAENRVDGPVIGLAFDGTGLGSDGHIWGGEVLISEAHRFERVAHLAYVPMPGGEAAIREPWRMALSHLHHSFGADTDGLDLPLSRQTDPEHRRFVLEMAAKRVNAPLTSSLGRLFDAVAALAGLRPRVSFEGQAAMELEMAADPEPPAVLYAHGWDTQNGVSVIQTAPLIRGVVADLEAGRTAGYVSARFHATLVRLFADLCGQLRRDTGLDRVALSGGVFQNVMLLAGLKHALEEGGFHVYTHALVPCNDGGIALGQAVAAARMADPHMAAADPP